MLEAKDISVSAGGRPVFAGVSFAVADGRMLGITGASGSGKSTLLKALLGFQPLDGGHISIDGELLTPSSAEEFRKIISYIPQETDMPVERVRDMVSLTFSLKANRSVPFSKDRLMEEWERLGLASDLYNKRMDELNGSERHRVLLSVAGLLRRPILLTDEPAGGFDSATAALIAGWLGRQTASGCTIVTVTGRNTPITERCNMTIDISQPSSTQTDTY